MTHGIDAAHLLRTARERSGLSQRALARRAHTSQSVVARIELGETTPTVSTLNRMMAAAGQYLDVRLGEDGTPFARRAQRYFAVEAPAGIVCAYLFGSTARGERHRESDVDLAVLLDRARYPHKRSRDELRIRLSAELIAALGTNEIDLLVLNDSPPGISCKVVLDGLPLLVSDPERAYDFSRDVQLRRADLRPFLERTSRLKREALRR